MRENQPNVSAYGQFFLHSSVGFSFGFVRSVLRLCEVYVCNINGGLNLGGTYVICFLLGDLFHGVFT